MNFEWLALCYNSNFAASVKTPHKKKSYFFCRKLNDGIFIPLFETAFFDSRKKVVCPLPTFPLPKRHFTFSFARDSGNWKDW
jgi:hypothetical protein